MKISAAIIAKNEEVNILEAIESVRWTDEIVVVDSGSSDRTKEIAAEAGAKVIHQEWLGFGLQKQFAAESCTNDWVLSLDADERITPELAKEVQDISNAEPEYDAYRIPRETVYMGRAIRHSGWFPDYQLRLFRKSKGRWKEMIVHESFKLNEGTKMGTLNNLIRHYSISSAAEHYKMIGERYAPLGARQMELDGRITNRFVVCITGPLTFLRSYILKLGFLDGFPGFVIAMFAGIHAYLKHLTLLEKQESDPSEKRVE